MIDRGFTVRHRRRRLGHDRGRSADPRPATLIPAAPSVRPAASDFRRTVAGVPRLRNATSIHGVADADEMREQMRQGADQVKIMCSGGVASPYDPLDSLQFSEAEIAAATDEARNFGRYVLAHAYTPEAITRAVTHGVRTIEHGNLIDAKSAKLLKSKGGYMIANLVTYFVMKERAAQFGMTADMLAKNDLVMDGALRSLEICKAAGVKVGYGSDLWASSRSSRAASSCSAPRC
jgi:imidazolonepropionase-like amidohydrolase